MVQSTKESSILEGLVNQAQNVPTDDVPAKLTKNEYVIPADVVITLGNGDAEAGIQMLDSLVENVRAKTQGVLASEMNKMV
jgi:hypothetical protein